MTSATTRTLIPFEQRLWSRIVQGPPEQCWPYVGRQNEHGYGRLSRGGHRGAPEVYAHRAVYELTYGLIPDGSVIRHSCDNPPCCNPSHLLRGTQADNVRDTVERGRQRNGVFQGESHPRAKLTDAQVDELLTARRTDATYNELADRFGIGLSQISRICRGESRTHHRVVAFDLATATRLLRDAGYGEPLPQADRQE